MGKIIQQGAEALIIKEKNKILKRRIKKSYRLPEIDEKIRKKRTKIESRLLQKASTLIPVPKLLRIDIEKEEIDMEFLQGKKLSEHLDSLINSKTICKQIGQNTAKLHDANIIHGDLTTSNMILKNNKVYFIDFGLSFNSHKIEDKAVDLHLLKQALEAKHFKHYKTFFSSILQGYCSSKNYKDVLKRLEKVEKRGRYKPQY